MTALAERIAREFGTPAVVIDLDRVERNITRVQAACDAAGVALHLRNVRNLVRLDVRPVRDTGGVAGRLDAGDVALDPVEVDHHRGRAELARDSLSQRRHGSAPPCGSGDRSAAASFPYPVGLIIMRT